MATCTSGAYEMGRTEGLSEVERDERKILTCQTFASSDCVIDLQYPADDNAARLVAGTGTVTAVGRDVDCLQIRLSPVLARAVFGAGDPTGVLSLDTVWGRDAERLCARLHTAASWDERFAIATTELARRREAGPAVDPEVAAAWHWMAHSHGQVRIERIADELGWSRKRLWSRFATQIGLPPKRAAQLIRFDDAAHRLATGAAPVEVADACGYADQSHLHRDARLFAGMTPAGVAAAPWLDVDPVAWR